MRNNHIAGDGEGLHSVIRTGGILDLAVSVYLTRNTIFGMAAEQRRLVNERFTL